MKKMPFAIVSIFAALALGAGLLSCRVADIPAPKVETPWVLVYKSGNNYDVYLDGPYGTGVTVYYSLDDPQCDASKAVWPEGDSYTPLFIPYTISKLRLRAYYADYEPSDILVVDLASSAI